MINWTKVLMSESNLWRYIQKNLKSYGVLSRVENAFYKGMPDVNYLIDGVEGWIELKFISQFPARQNTIVRVPHFTEEQKIWHEQRVKYKGNTTVLIQVERDYFIFKKDKIKLVGSLTRNSMVKLANKHWPKRINFKELRKELCIN
jgi:hypothetical protein